MSMNSVASAPSWGFLFLLLPVGILAIAQLACLGLVIAEMFKQGQTGMGVACVALCFCAGFGSLFAHIYGWVKSSQWGLRTLMLVWTGCFVVNLVLVAVVGLASVGFSTSGY
jgi:hypothetical protein